MGVGSCAGFGHLALDRDRRGEGVRHVVERDQVAVAQEDHVGGFA
jgi:hypothetical protein